MNRPAGRSSSIRFPCTPTRPRQSACSDRSPKTTVDFPDAFVQIATTGSRSAVPFAASHGSHPAAAPFGAARLTSSATSVPYGDILIDAARITARQTRLNASPSSATQATVRSPARSTVGTPVAWSARA